jgi:hypothetical protein
VLGTSTSPRGPIRTFPRLTSSGAQSDPSVELHYDHVEDRLSGTLGEEAVEWRRSDRRTSGHIGALSFEASWRTGDNFVPEPGGWTPGPDYVSDFPNIPTDLSGSFAGLEAELQGVFHLEPDFAFERGSILGRIGTVHLEATVLKASGGLSDSRTVAVEGNYGSVSFEIYATIDGGLSQGILHGSIDESTVHIDFSRPEFRRGTQPGDPLRDYAGIDLSGNYDGPPELLAVMVGAILEFM